MTGRFCWWDGSLWWRTYTPGGYDGYRTVRGRKLPCATMRTALERPGLRDEIRQLAAPRRRTPDWWYAVAETRAGAWAGHQLCRRLGVHTVCCRGWPCRARVAACTQCGRQGDGQVLYSWADEDGTRRYICRDSAACCGRQEARHARTERWYRLVPLRLLRWHTGRLQRRAGKARARRRRRV